MQRPSVSLFSNLRGNLFGGLTAAVIALPLALAFGVASGLGAAAGLYGAIILGFFAALFGGTPTQISGPTGPMTVVVAAAVATLGGDIGLVATVVLLAGIFQIVFGFTRIGRFVRFIPYPVISGFMSGIGVIIILLQLNPLLGLPSDAAVLHLLVTLPSLLPQTNFWALLLALAALAIVFFTPARLAKVVPSPLIALVVLTPLSALLQLPVETIGTIPAELPALVLPDFKLEHYTVIISLAFTLAVLGTIDTLLTSIVADSITRTKHNPDRELFGQGLGNTLCALVGAVPGAGATMRTVINVKSGGTDRLSGMTHAVVLLLIVLFLAPLASKIPLAVLAGILIKVGVDILDYRFLKVWKESPRSDLMTMLTVFFVTVFVDLITAVGLGIVLASLLIVYRITKETQIVLETAGAGTQQPDLEAKNARIIRINGAFFFGSSTFFERQANNLLDTKTVIIDIMNVPFMDITAIFTLKDLIEKLKTDGVRVIIAAPDAFAKKLMRFNHEKRFENVDFAPSLQSAVALI
ncbi:SulP family inorganic anion transporter [Sulfurimonas sp. HSL1-2]|uniref:SulP family inorganic anion transporter n=1 Tax=Thiomicrolovo zhangzhouensis TaxID=3131933 RepID=UPI0031F7A8D3